MGLYSPIELLSQWVLDLFFPRLIYQEAASQRFLSLLEAPAEAVFPKGEEGDSRTGLETRNQVAFIPKTAASPGVPLGPALRGANPNPSSLVVKKHTLPNPPRVLLESWHEWFLIT